MWFVPDENLFDLGIGRITSAIQPVLLIVFHYGSEKLEVTDAEDTNRRQLLALSPKPFIGHV
jgi:hypothetical protein